MPDKSKEWKNVEYAFRLLSYNSSLYINKDKDKNKVKIKDRKTDIISFLDKLKNHFDFGPECPPGTWWDPITRACVSDPPKPYGGISPDKPDQPSIVNTGQPPIIT
jgi:hypothetical protein